MTLTQFNPKWKTAIASVAGDGSKSVVKVDVVHPKYVCEGYNVLVEIAVEDLPYPTLAYSMPEGLIWICLEIAA